MPTATQAEVRIVVLYLTCGSVKVAADEFGITDRAFRERLARIYRKYRVTNRAQLVYVLRHQLPDGLTVTSDTLDGR